MMRQAHKMIIEFISALQTLFITLLCVLVIDGESAGTLASRLEPTSSRDAHNTEPDALLNICINQDFRIKFSYIIMTYAPLNHDVCTVSFVCIVRFQNQNNTNQNTTSSSQ